ncbi:MULTISPECIES: chemotaxis protein CheD [Vibrio]|uniref:chemotaxis protein CheD n=1 Tax=Vibrio TaxID=662 RepID=UPI002074DE1B|nr:MULTISPECIES: chemotaxis protein CheD [Vibrio]USD34751.1 chemotaxis protein CheD [Vibrio sp. SCSIO 43186]USD47817.1 chemotaxis protein CheD [Vibrio sp. SCSIO 43145]USD71876.1 chemotaxis protein CheD [Vibrio sp. SCSIO 43139]USD97535.1 chemotaxis protein CheD [Vibrio coralliilyticus]
MIGLKDLKPKYENSHFNRFYHPQKERHMIKVFPGGVYWTQEDELIATGLGSCIAACIWDDSAAVGGMNHFLLPFHNHSEINSWSPDEVVSTASRYGSHAMEMLINALIAYGATRSSLKVKLFGGAQMLGHHSMIGEKNIAFILNYVKQENLDVIAQDLGGLEPRKIIFNPLTGQAWLKRIPYTEVHHLQQEEDKYASQLDKESHRPHDDDVELFS